MFVALRMCYAGFPLEEAAAARYDFDKDYIQSVLDTIEKERDTYKGV